MSMDATTKREKTARWKISVLRRTKYAELMLKIAQIKEPNYTLVLQKHLSKRVLQITTKIWIMNNTKKARVVKIYMVVKRGSNNVYNEMTNCWKSMWQNKINLCSLCLAEKLHLGEHFNDNQLLNKRNESISGCKHQVKFLLKSFKRK